LSSDAAADVVGSKQLSNTLRSETNKRNLRIMMVKDIWIERRMDRLIDRD
jgi:hypothetical protein